MPVLDSTSAKPLIGGRRQSLPGHGHEERLPEPVCFPSGDLFSAEDLDHDAVKVINRLTYSGYTAYLVGGCVRDLLLGLVPKDFDIATDARPRQVKRLFRNSRIIGRRFRLVHITFAGKVLEVSTFRALRDPLQGTEDLLILQDNVFGKPHEDARRRDFTINGLFYDLQRRQVIDYVGGLEDLRRRILRTIGNPWVRFREDPVRMMRAIKFAGRLGFRLADDLYQAIIDCREDIRKAAPPRLLEEILRLMQMGGAHRSLRLLYKTGLLHILLPEVARALDARVGAREDASFWASLREIDRISASGVRVPSTVLFGTLFILPLHGVVIPAAPGAELPRFPEVDRMMEDLLRPAALRLRISRRDVAGMKQIFRAQRYLTASQLKGRQKRRAMGMVSRPWFPEAVMLLRILSAAEGRFARELAFWSEQVPDSPRPFIRKPPSRRRRARVS